MAGKLRKLRKRERGGVYGTRGLLCLPPWAPWLRNVCGVGPTGSQSTYRVRIYAVVTLYSCIPGRMNGISLSRACVSHREISPPEVRTQLKLDDSPRGRDRNILPIDMGWILASKMSGSKGGCFEINSNLGSSESRGVEYTVCEELVIMQKVHDFISTVNRLYPVRLVEILQDHDLTSTLALRVPGNQATWQLECPCALHSKLE